MTILKALKESSNTILQRRLSLFLTKFTYSSWKLKGHIKLSFLDKENRIYIRGEFEESLCMIGHL